MSLSPATADPMQPHLSGRRTLLPWYIIEFLNSYAATLFCAGCYDYADEILHVTPAARLWLSAAWGFAYIFIALGAGRLSEKLGPRRVVGTMIAGCIATTLLALIAIHMHSIWILLAVMLPMNITSTMIWPALESAITRSPAKMRLSTRMAIYNLSWGSAGFAALFTRGTLEHLDWSMIFIAPAIASALALLIFATRAIPAAMISADHVPEESGGEHDVDDPAIRRRAKNLLIMAWIGNTLAYVAINVVTPVQMRLANEAGFTDLRIVAFVTSIWSFMRFVGFGLTWKWAGWHYKNRWLIGSQIALAASFCAMLLNSNPWTLGLAQGVFGLSAALVYSSSLYYAMHVSSGHGGHAGVHEALIGAGIAIGPAVGAIAGGNDFSTAALARIAISVTAVMLLGILVQSFIAYRGRTPLQPTATPNFSKIEN